MESRRVICFEEMTIYISQLSIYIYIYIHIHIYTNTVELGRREFGSRETISKATVLAQNGTKGGLRTG